jgi:hypothetical protein
MSKKNPSQLLIRVLTMHDSFTILFLILILMARVQFGDCAATHGTLIATSLLGLTLHVSIVHWDDGDMQRFLYEVRPAPPSSQAGRQYLR